MIKDENIELFHKMVAQVAGDDRLTQMKNRASVQLDFIDMVRSLIPEDDRSVVWEVGYGGGRTYDRLRRVFAQNPITVFDNRPDGTEMVEGDGNIFHYGDVFEVLPPIVSENIGKVRFMHADIGTSKFDRDMGTYASLGALAAPALAPGALVASDRPIAVECWTLLKCGLDYPWSYFLWQV